MAPWRHRLECCGMEIEELVFNPRGPVVNDRQIRRAEKRLGVVFPDDYRRFLKLHNGGSADYRTVDQKLDIRFWLSICESDTGEADSIFKANELVRNKDWGNTILIGFTGGDLHIVMRIEGKNNARVGLYDWGTMEIHEAKLTYGSFTEFVADLQPYDWELD